MKTYTVSGSLPYRGHRPGETFEEDIPAEQAERALARGSIVEGGEMPQEHAGDAPADDRIRLKRPELDELARAAGVEHPEDFGNKGEVLAALLAAEEAGGATTEEPTDAPEGDDGDGTETPDASGNDQ